jgi:hypothetical protein
MPVVIATACLVSGCAVLQQDLGKPLPLDEMDKVEAGSHFAEVLDEFGPPTKMSSLPDGMVFQYEYIRLKERQYGLIFPGEIGKWIKAVFGSADADIEVALFIFDQDGVLRGSDAEAWRADAGAGFSVTLIFSAGSLTDTQNYEQSASRALEWGAALTQPPLNTLNARQDLETGANGVQLTATATRVGQHSLELEK